MGSLCQKILPEIKTLSLLLQVCGFLTSNGCEAKMYKECTKMGANLAGFDKENSGEVFPLKEGTLSINDKGSFKFRNCKRETLEKKIFKALAELCFFWTQLFCQMSVDSVMCIPIQKFLHRVCIVDLQTTQRMQVRCGISIDHPIAVLSIIAALCPFPMVNRRSKVHMYISFLENMNEFSTHLF